jgi:glycosyltransferase involved in cell wall biosynthesis
MIVACISASRVPSTAANSMQVMKACQAISQLGHEVHLFLPRHKLQARNIDLGSYYGLKTQFAIEYLSSHPNLNRYDFSIWATRKARKIKADLAYVWIVQAGIFSLLAHLPVIFELHGPPEGKFGPTLFRLFQKIGGTKRLLPITKALASQLHERFNIDLGDSRLVRTAPNGVDLERYIDLPDPVTARAQLSLPSALTVGYSGHLYPGRGMNLLVELARCFPMDRWPPTGCRNLASAIDYRKVHQRHPDRLHRKQPATIIPGRSRYPIDALRKGDHWQQWR